MIDKVDVKPNGLFRQMSSDDTKSALLSASGEYRYELKRALYRERHRNLLFIMLNPSTADGLVDDPTIRRCIGFAKNWGFQELTVVNMFAYRATKPNDMKKATDPVGPGNDVFIRDAIRASDKVVCAWGANGCGERAKKIIELAAREGRRLWCLGVTKKGFPRHPLYIKADHPPIPWGLNL